MELPLLYEDDAMLVVNKPSGLLVHRGDATSRREIALLQLLRDQMGQRLYPVHRLDRATSGIVLFAKDPQAAALLSEQFRKHQVGKNYLAVVRGWAPELIVCDDPLANLDRKDAPLQDASTRGQRIAQVAFPVAIDRYPEARYSLLHLMPLTGRQHQLRRHMKHLGYPMIGDTVYGKGLHNRFFRDSFAVHRLLLHHWTCSWTTSKGERREVRAPWDEAWDKVIQACHWQQALSEVLCLSGLG